MRARAGDGAAQVSRKKAGVDALAWSKLQARTRIFEAG
jgi:hypothetical protein